MATVGMNGILSSAVSGLLTNTSALDVVSDNVSNINTVGYVRRTVNLSTAASGSNVTGVTVADVTRTVSEYLDQETLSAQGASSRYNIQNSIYSQVEASLGSVGDGNSLSSKLTDIGTALSTLSQTPSSSSAKDSVVSAAKTFASKVSTLYSQLNTLSTSVDGQVTSTVDSINSDIKNIVELNQQISYQTSVGNDTTGLCDQRDASVLDLAQYLDVRTSKQTDGTVRVMTSDGANLVGDTYATLSVSQVNGDPTISATYANPQTGVVSGTAGNFNSHISAGQLGGLLEMQGNIDSLSSELGNLASSVSNAYNSVSNDYSAYPPPQTLTGRQTGLVGDESLNINGTTTIALTDSSGNLVSSYNLDFTGMSADSIASSIGSAFGGDVTASFDEGKLTISAADSSHGVVIDDSGNTGDTDFSSFFGMNDLFATSIPTYSTTGLSASSSCNLAGAGSISLALKDSTGATVKSATVAVNASDSIETVLNSLSTAMDSAVTFTVNSDGSVTTTLASGYKSDTLYTTQDTTERGDTGINLTQFLGIGSNVQAAAAADFAVKSTLSSSTLPTSTISIGASSSAVVQSGDSAGAIALQQVETATQSIAAAGNLAARSSSIGDYANAFYQDVSTRSATASDNYDTQSDRLTEAKKNQSDSEGVNLDEELSNMVVYQQAYNASARLLTTYQDMYDTLLQIGQ